MRWFILSLGVACGGAGTGTTPTGHTGETASHTGETGGETGSPRDTGPTDTGTGHTGETCDPAEEVAGFFCRQDLCNLCTDDCATRDEIVTGVASCDTTSDPYACCVETCTDPALGALEKVYCPAAYGGESWWFDPVSGALVGYAWSTDYNEWCDGGAFGQLFGPDLTGCQ